MPPGLLTNGVFWPIGYATLSPGFTFAFCSALEAVSALCGICSNRSGKLWRMRRTPWWRCEWGWNLSLPLFKKASYAPDKSCATRNHATAEFPVFLLEAKPISCFCCCFVLVSITSIGVCTYLIKTVNYTQAAYSCQKIQGPNTNKQRSTNKSIWGASGAAIFESRRWGCGDLCPSEIEHKQPFTAHVNLD